MIDILKQQIEEKVGKKIANRGDCELLSNIILETLDVEISYNTIRRLYGLAPFTKPNQRTLNILSQLIGYKNYVHFTLNFNYREKINLSKITYKAVYDDNEETIIKLVKTNKKKPENFIDFFTLLARELFHNKNFDLLNKLFELEELNYKNFTYSELLHLGNSLGLLLRKQPIIDNALLVNINFLHFVYLTFVDYSSLNGYYGEWTSIIKQHQISKETIVFTSSLLEFKNFLNNLSAKNRYEELMYSTDTNPILCSRLLALKLLDKNSNQTKEIVNIYFKAHPKKFFLTDYSYELFSSAIITKNIQLMELLVLRISENKKTYFYYQKYHLNSFYLMCMFYYKLKNKKDEEKKYSKLFNINESRYSYQEYITLLHQIYLFHGTQLKNKKTLFKKKYATLSNQFNYPYFSEDFLMNYFS